MPYVGKTAFTTFTETVKDSFNGDNSTVAFTMSQSVGLDTDIEVFVGNVQQEPGSGKAYTVSGTTLTFSEAPPTGTANIYVIHRNSLQGTLLPPQNLGDKNYLIGGNLSLDADSAALNFGADSEITVTHNADTGLLFKHTATSGTPPTLTFQTGTTDIVQDSVLGRLLFQAPDEGTGTDAITSAARIQALSEGDFSSSNNATSIEFRTATSGVVGTAAQGSRLTLQSDANLLLKDMDTADGSSPTITLQTGDTDIAQDDVLGTINFQAPDEGTGTDAILVAAGISAVSEGDFSSSSNATKLSFKTGASEAATEKMSLGSGGDLSILTDGASIFFGADSEIELRHVADDGLILKHVGTGDGKEPSLTFQAGDNDIAVDDLLGSIQFQAPDEGAGSDAVLVAAAISAVSEGDFSSTSNATGLRFQTGASETATTKMKLSSAGGLIMQPAAGGHAIFNEDSVDADFRVESNGNTHMLFVDGGNDAVAVGTSSADTNATMTVSNTGDNHAISIVGALNKSRMHFQGANTGSASTDGLVIGLSSSDDTNDDSALIGLKESGSMSFQTAGTNRMIIDGTGAVTKPAQPAFLAFFNTVNSNISVDTHTHLYFDTEIFDQNGDYASNTFTAPVTGRYQFNFHIRVDNIDRDAHYYTFSLVASNRTMGQIFDPDFADQDIPYYTAQLAVLVDMDANDTAKVSYFQSAGGAVTDLDNGYFSGYLVC